MDAATVSICIPRTREHEASQKQRLYAIVVWRETPFFTERERAALAWTEAVTQVSNEHVSDEVYELAHRHFNDKELVDLTLAIIAINGWNRLATAKELGVHKTTLWRRIKQLGLQIPED